MSGKLSSTRLFLILLVISLTATGAWVAGAAAQSPAECGGSGATPGTFSITPDSGPAGTAALITGTLSVQPTVDGMSERGESLLSTAAPTVTVYWLETGWLDASELENLLPDGEGNVSGNITIPEGAAAGPHEIGLWYSLSENPACLTFTVTQSVQQTAYPATARTSMPNTGSMLFIPAAGLALAAVCLLLMGGRWGRSRR
jgi:hypothetical protein